MMKVHSSTCCAAASELTMSTATKTEVKTITSRINELVKKSMTKTEIKTILKLEDYTKADIEANDALIPSKKANVVDEVAIMKLIIDCEANSMSRKDTAILLNHMNLCTVKTGQHILSLMKFAKAYHQLMK